MPLFHPHPPAGLRSAQPPPPTPRSHAPASAETRVAKHSAAPAILLSSASPAGFFPAPSASAPRALHRSETTAPSGTGPTPRAALSPTTIRKIAHAPAP